MVFDRRETLSVRFDGSVLSGVAQIGTATLSDDAADTLDAGSVFAGEYITSLIALTARPGRVLTGNTAPWWPVFTRMSSLSFVADYDQFNRVVGGWLRLAPFTIAFTIVTPTLKDRDRIPTPVHDAN